MKRISILFAAVLLFTILFIPKHAEAQFGFIEMYTTNAYGSVNLKEIFGPEETPYLYMKLDIPAGERVNTISAWNDPDAIAHFNSSSLSTDVERWESLNNWSSVNKVGPWVIYANYFDSAGNNTVGSAKFTVTPEPGTLSLFCLSGALLAFNRKKRL